MGNVVLELWVRANFLQHGQALARDEDSNFAEELLRKSLCCNLEEASVVGVESCEPEGWQIIYFQLVNNGCDDRVTSGEVLD